MRTITQINTANVAQIMTKHESITSLYQVLRQNRIIMTTGRKSVKHLNTENLIKQLSSTVLYLRSNKDKFAETELTDKTEIGMIKSIYSIPRKKTMKKRRHPKTVKKGTRMNNRVKKFKNILEEIKTKTNNLIKNKLNLYANARKLARKTRRILPIARKIESLEKLLTEDKNDMETNEIIEDLFHCSMRSINRNVFKWKSNELQVLPVGIVPPLPMPMWTKAMIDSPDFITVRRTPSMCHVAMKSKLTMKGRSKHVHRKRKHCMIHTESLTRVLNSQKWNKGARQVSAATFRATRVHYRYLQAKYGKSRLMGRQRVYPFVNKPSVHSNFSVINLLHAAEEAFTQNRFSKERDKMMRNFKEELNKDLFSIETIHGKSHRYQSSEVKKRFKLANHSSIISFSEFLEATNGNVVNDFSINKFVKDFEPGMEINDILFENRHVKPLNINKLFMNSLTDSDSDELLNSCSSELDTDFNTKTGNENIDLSKLFSKKRQTIKEKSLFFMQRNAKKKRNFVKEPKPEYLTEKERLYAVMQELHKQLKVSELTTPLQLAKDDSLTELNFEKEPLTYLSMTGSSSTVDILSKQPKQLEVIETESLEYIQAESSEEEKSEQTTLVEEETTPIIQENKIKKHHSSTKSYTFRIDYECIKDKPSNICNIVTALDRVNKLLKDIPIQHDEKTGQPYIVYDPKTIIKVIAQVNTKCEYKTLVKKYNKRTKSSFVATHRNIYKTNELQLKASNVTSTQFKEDNSCLETIGNQLLNCILKSMKTQTHSTANVVNQSQSKSIVTFTESEQAETEYTQVFNNKNFNNIANTQMHNLCNSMPINLNQMTYAPNSLNHPWENRISVSPLTGKKIRRVEKYYYLLKKGETNYQMAGIYYQIITYMERREYVTANQSTTHYGCNVNEGINLTDIINKQKTSEALNIHHDIYSTDMINNRTGHNFEFKTNGSIPYDLIKKYRKELQKVKYGKSLEDISTKYYSRYSRTKKYRASGNEITRKYENQRNELALKYRNRSYGRVTDNYNKYEYELNLTGQKNNYNAFKGRNEHHNSKYRGGQTGPDFIRSNPVKLKNEVSYEPEKYKISNVTKEEFLLFPYHKQSEDHNRKVQCRINSSNIDTGCKYLEKVFPNQTGLLNPINDKSEIQKYNSYSYSFIKNIMKSASINTMQNTQTIRKGVIKQVFYFHIQQPATVQLEEIFNRKTPNEYFIPYPGNVFSNFYNYKEQSNLHTYKKNINEQVMGCVNKIKDDLNENIGNICKIVNINKPLLIKFLKICLQQNELHFDKTEKSRNLEKEINELKLEIEEQFDLKMNPLCLITKKNKRMIREEKRTAPKIKATKIRQLTVIKKENEENYETIYKNILSFGIIGFLHFLMFIFVLMSFF